MADLAPPHRSRAPWILTVAVIAVALCAVAIAVLSGSRETAGAPVRTADADGYLSKIETYTKQRVRRDDEHRLISAGHELCAIGIDGTDLSDGRQARTVIAEHELSQWYQDSWPAVSGAADEYLC